VNTLAPKLVLTPLLVAMASLAGRRWGPLLSGWLVALPLTSGPIVLRGLVTGMLGFGAFFLALGWLLGVSGIIEAFLGALIAGSIVQAATLPLLRSR
jgi:hypothetical protein